MFEVDLGKVRFNWKGTWDAGVAYAEKDCVVHGGSSYVATSTSNGVLPTDVTKWNTLALGSDLGSLAVSPGDFFYYNGTSLRRLAAGSNGQILKMGANGAPSWTDPDLLSPILQTRNYVDYNRTTVNNGGAYYFGQSGVGVTITPRKITSLIRVRMDLFSEVNSHDTCFRVQYSKDAGANWSNMRMATVNQNVHGMFNGYEYIGDYSTTPAHSNFELVQAFSTQTPIIFRIVVAYGASVVMNGGWSGGSENAQSSIQLTELNSDFNSVSYIGGA
jgi:hypothetical protein